MSERARNGSLDAFMRVAAWYFENPPASWCLSRRASGWLVTARDGTYISSHRTRRDAAAHLTAGPCARSHYATLDWYLGYGSELPPLTDAEREAVAQVLSSIDSLRRFGGSNGGEVLVMADRPTAQAAYDTRPGLVDGKLT